MQGNKLYEAALTEMHKNNPNVDLVLSLLHQAINIGDYRASYALGTWYLHGKYVERDVNKAFNLIEYAAKGKIPEACYDIAVCYETGIGVKENKEKAFNYYLEAAEKGDKSSIYEVGRCYYYGIGTVRNTKIGKIWLNNSNKTVQIIKEEICEYNFSKRLNKLFREAKWEKAKQILIKKHLKSPNEYYFLTELSQVCYALEQYKDALIYSESAMKIEPDDILVVYNYGCALSGVNREREAIEQWNKILNVSIEEIAYGKYGEGMRWAKSLTNDTRYLKATSLIAVGNKNEALQLINEHLQYRRCGIYSDFSKKQILKKRKLLLERLQGKQKAGTLTPSEKNKLKAHEKNVGQRRSRQSKDKN